MNKNYVVAGLVVLVLLVGGVVFAFKEKIKAVVTPEAVVTPVVEQMPVPGEEVSEKEVIVEVEKTDTGYTPKEITVKKGTTVKFVNKSATAMWVASAPHPIHIDYSAFDQKSNGDEYSFTFDQVGTWKYHNHAPFQPGGTVVVTE